ncbi:putative hydrolase of the alpha/beta superfamily [Wolbachia endosymbiont wPip_Mol of Culex molestus]|nr:putative hydrolase of the alpha/beta superfamily [Wolbachia endosymbiont wPip_Mol of Culex molestus]
MIYLIFTLMHTNTRLHFKIIVTYALTSFVCLLASILPPTVILLTNPITARTAGLAVLSASACVFLSIFLLMIPFLNKDQKLFKSSIEQIDQLIYQGVKPENIILFGHSFGGAVASEVSRHFANRDVKLGGIVFTSTFSSFHTAIEHFPMPQTKILSILPLFLLKRILKAFALDFDIADNLQKSQNEKTPIVIINHARDTLIPLPAQLVNAIRGDQLLNGNPIKIRDDLFIYGDDPHNSVLDSGTLTEELREMVLSKVTSRTR